MFFAAQELLEQALAMTPPERAMPASGLLASLDGDHEDEDEVERLWSAETERRARQIARDDVPLLTWDDALAAVSRPSSSTE